MPAGRESVFAFLAGLENHWLLADRWIELVSLDEDGLGGRVRMRGPLGVRRTATTRVLSSTAPERLQGQAALGRTRARVRWILEPRGAHTSVRLLATIESASALDRLLLMLGGRAWLKRRFAATLRELAAAQDWAASTPRRPATRPVRA